MDLQKCNLLFFTRTMGTGGTEKVIMQLCEVLKPYVNKIIVCSVGGENVEFLKDEGIEFYEIPDITIKSPENIFSVLYKVYKIIKSENITVVHTHHRMAAFYARVLSSILKFTFINTSHNVFQDKKILTRFAYKKANLIACGNMVKKNLVGFYGFPEERVKAIPNAVKPFKEEVVAIKQLTDLKESGYFLIGNIARLSKQKGVEYYIRSVPQVLKNNPMTKFIIIGDGEEYHPLRLLVEKLGVKEAVLFLGYRRDIQNVMSQLDLIVLSSLWEGLPLTPAEAFSVSKTIVATAVDGTREIVQDLVNGILVPPESEDKIAEAICLLQQDSKLRSRLEESAYATYTDRFSFQSWGENYLRYYEGVQ